LSTLLRAIAPFSLLFCSLIIRPPIRAGLNSCHQLCDSMGLCTVPTHTPIVRLSNWFGSTFFPFTCVINFNSHWKLKKGGGLNFNCVIRSWLVWLFWASRHMSAGGGGGELVYTERTQT
jgi:hypothetical protein